MNFIETNLKGAYLIELQPNEDDRGLFSRIYCKNEFRRIGHEKEFVQINFSKTNHEHCIRGMHYQTPPAAEIKLIKCIKGRVFDVIVDLRKGSPTFLKYYSVELSSMKQQLLYVPEGFAHGFQTLDPESEMLYFHTSFYDPPYYKGLHYNDPLLDIHWPFPVYQLSESDANLPYIDNTFQGILLTS